MSRFGVQREDVMKSAVRLLAVFAAVMLAGFVAQAQAGPDCGENTGKKATGKPIPIGPVTTMSGFGSFKEADDAVRAYFDYVNANGGIHGRPITYHDEDDQSQLDVAAQAAKKLVGDEGVYAMIGNTSIIECTPNANYYAKEGMRRSSYPLSEGCAPRPAPAA
jgi:branched-chain amino acid transport system substrate-binding protein